MSNGHLEKVEEVKEAIGRMMLDNVPTSVILTDLRNIILYCIDTIMMILGTPPPSA